MSRKLQPTAVVIGFIARIPLAGMVLYCLHHIVGLLELGYEVFYLERQNVDGDCYDARTNHWSNDCAYGLRHLERELRRIGIAREMITFIDRKDQYHGASREKLLAALDKADFVLALSDATWIEDLGRCPNRIFVDGDPMFTQCLLLRKESRIASVLPNYNKLFTYATRLGAPDCPVPAAGRSWMAARPVVATSIWPVFPPTGNGPIATIMKWGGKPFAFDGRTYGHKAEEFAKFIDAPRTTGQSFEVALGGDKAPRALLVEHGWTVSNPIAASRTIDDYRSFIARSRCDFGVANATYVQSRCGWFSDRSTCFLAAGRPVLHQETGFTDWLDVQDGVIPFSTMDELVEGVQQINRDYKRQARAARSVAEEHFEASTVLDELLTNAGCR